MKIVRPLAILDLETTGVWIEKDRIIEVAIVKLHPDGKREQYVSRVNPEMPIPAVVTELTGISDADVKDAPKFREIAQAVFEFLGDADLGGFNVERFDLPVLKRELFEANIVFDWETRTIYDAQQIYHFHEKRDLTAAYRFYCNKEMINAHSALSDVEATVAILDAQVARYGDGTGELSTFSNVKTKRVDTFFDKNRKFKWWNGALYPTFGKYGRRTSVTDLAVKDPGYLKWLLDSDFEEPVKVVIREALAAAKQGKK